MAGRASGSTSSASAGVGMVGRDRGRVVRRPSLARAGHGRPVHHGRRAHLLGARPQPRRQPRAPRARRSIPRLRDRLPGAHQPCLRGFRAADGRLCGGEDAERARHVAGRDPRVPPRPSRRRRRALAARRGAGGLASLARLHGLGHDGERVLPRLSRLRPSPHPRPRAADHRQAGCASARGRRRRRDARAGCRARARAAHGSAAPRRCSAGKGCG